MADKTIESTKDALKRLRDADEKKKESRKKSKRKTGIKKFLASLLAVTSVLTFSCSGKNKNNNSKQDEIKTTVSDDDEIKPNVSEEKKEEKLKSHSLDSLGVELEFPKEDEIIENHFSNPQGDFNFDELV